MLIITTLFLTLFNTLVVTELSRALKHQGIEISAKQQASLICLLVVAFYT